MNAILKRYASTADVDYVSWKWNKAITGKQRWSPRGRPWPRGHSWPRGHILKSLTLASKPQVLENWPFLGLRTALIFELLKFCGEHEKFPGRRFFLEISWKIFVKTFLFWKSPIISFLKTFFLWRALALAFLVLGLGLKHSCPCSQEGLSSEGLYLASDFFCVLGLGLGLEPYVFDSTSADEAGNIPYKRRNHQF